MKRRLYRCCWGSAFLSLAAQAGVMRHDINVQDYRDFAENLGKYKPGATHVPVYRKDNSLDGYLDFPLPDFGMVANGGYATLISPSYVAGVRHNKGYKTVSFGNGAKYAASYKLISRNEHSESSTNYHLPRLNKVVTDAAPVDYVEKSVIRQADHERYSWYTRVGGGTQAQISDDMQQELQLASAYAWKTAGTLFGEKINFAPGTLRWQNYAPDSPFSSPFSSAILGGDSGSPVFAYDSLEKKWKVVGVMHAAISNKGPYQRISGAEYIPDGFNQDIMLMNRSPEITDIAANGNIHWNSAAITQGSAQWQWHGLDDSYASLSPANASNEALNATKDLHFNGEGGHIILDKPINLGAGNLRFSADYAVSSAYGRNATWVGGGVEVDKDRTVLWQVNGLDNDALHKIGAGVLHINASGVNAGALNVGDGTVILDQQADENGAKQAFSSVTLVSGRPTVILNSADQLRSDHIQFGYRGGTLDLNGNSLSFGEINHNDDGARIVNHHASQQATVTLNSNKYAFLGKFGDKASADRLNLIFQPDNNLTVRQLAGGAELNQLAVNAGELSLTGQRVYHAGKVYYSNDWDEKYYSANTLTVAPDAALTLGEHGNLTTAATLTGNARLNLYARSALDGSVMLTDSDSVLYADIRQRASTAGELASRIDASISGKGWLEKQGEGRLTLNGEVTAEGGIALNQGELVVNNHITSPLNMAENTLLAGKGTLDAVIMASGATLFPGRAQPEDKIGTTLRIKNLTSSSANTLALNTRFSDGVTDRLLIDGDLQSANDQAIMVSVNPQGIWSDSDLNHNGIADNHEGISLIQVGGKASADSFKLAGSYVARGAWAWGLYAFAPGKASAEQRLLDGAGDRFWDYRLQNIMLSEDGNAIPAPPEPQPEPPPQPQPEPTPEPQPEPTPQPQPEPTPQPEPSPEPQPEPTPQPQPEPTPQPQPEPTPQPQPEPAPETQPTPVPDKVVRPAVIPQVPAYISLPTAFLSFEKNLLSLFKAQARDDSSFFAFCYKGSDRYHTRENFQRYGYNFHSQYHGWMLGTQRTLLDREQQRANLSVGVAWGKLSMVPQARDGVSNSQFDTLSLFSQLTWQHDSGLTLSAPFGYTHFRGKVNTDMRGRVASPTASSWHLGLDAEKTWQLGNHRVGPVAGLLYQHLQINSLRDSDNANVSWQMQRTPLYSLGAAWRYQCERCPTQQASLGGSLRYVHRSSHTNKTRVGDSTNHATFNSGKGGNGIQLAADMALNVADNVKLTGQLQHQRKTEKEGINDWGITGGIKVTF